MNKIGLDKIENGWLVTYQAPLPVLGQGNQPRMVTTHFTTLQEASNFIASLETK